MKFKFVPKRDYKVGDIIIVNGKKLSIYLTSQEYADKSEKQLAATAKFKAIKICD